MTPRSPSPIHGRALFVGLASLAFAPLGPGFAWADHGSQATRVGGGVEPWLLAAGLLAVVVAVAWAIFAPGATDDSEADRPPEQEGHTNHESPR